MKIEAKDILVKEEWVEVARKANGLYTRDVLECVIAAVLADIANNPPLPTGARIGEILNSSGFVNEFGEAIVRPEAYMMTLARNIFTVSFLKPKTAIPEAIKGMMVDESLAPTYQCSRTSYNAALLEAYEAGQRSK